MDESDLIHEVLELTLACQRPCASKEERARLERLLADNPQAILWYLQIVDDTLTLIDAAAANEAASESPQHVVASCGPAARFQKRKEPSRSPYRAARWWLAGAAIACGLLISVAASVWSLSARTEANLNPATHQDAARVVDISNIQWIDGARRYDEWELVRPGERLQIKTGWINLFLASGAELLIEGPADVEYVSAQQVFARQGKLAARIGPGAVGFRIDTPHAKVIDRGTSFGVSVDSNSHTSVVVYEGIVDLDVLGDRRQPRRRLAKGEALSIDGKGQLSRITTVQSAEFLEPPQVRLSGGQQGHIITTVNDNVRSLETAKYYRVIPRGFREDCRAYVDRLHEWNGVDTRGLPPFLEGGDYVMTFNDDKIVSEIELAVSVNQPANVYVLIDDRVPPPKWLKRDFVDTNWDVGCDEGWEDRIIDVSGGPGQSVEHVFSVWRRVVPKPTTVLMGALSSESPAPPLTVERSMYGIVVTPLVGD
jgi:ferric-dicitrate binding protein FerR (iron transport regulator)